MSAIIGNLRNVANDINNTVKAQNESLDRIHKKVKNGVLIVEKFSSKCLVKYSIPLLLGNKLKIKKRGWGKCLLCLINYSS